MTVDEKQLLTFLRHRRDSTRSVVVQAVYAGLEARVSRGDFEQQQQQEAA